MATVKRYWWQFVIVIIIVWIATYWFALVVEGQQPPCIIDASPMHQQANFLERVTNGRPYILYDKGLAIELPRAAREGCQIIIIPAWLDIFDTPGDCLPEQHVNVMIEALRIAARSARVYIGADDCEWFRSLATTVGVLGPNGERLTPDGADVYAYGCGLGVCTYSEAIVRAGMKAAE